MQNEQLRVTQAEFELLMLHVDGETPPERQAEVAELLRESAAAQALVLDLRLTREVLREVAIEARAQPALQRTDLSLLTGQILRKLPAEAAQPVAGQVEEQPGLLAWIRQLGMQKIGFSIGLAALVAAAMVVLAGPPATAPLTPQAQESEIAAVPGTNAAVLLDEQEKLDPQVIIEEMEIDSGSLMVHPPQLKGDSTVIWHFQGDDQGKLPATGGGPG